jgi:ribonuclease HII
MLYTGVDEVGYGALAGPIVAAAVTMRVSLPQERIHKYWPLHTVKDSKKTTEAQRERLRMELTEFLIENEAEVGLYSVEAKLIDELGYSRAADVARTRAVEKSTVEAGMKPGLIIVDGTVALKNPPGRQICVPQADGRYWLVAAASILAKIYRDDMMILAAKSYPHYQWEKNKGYTGGGIQDSPHVQALVDHGLSPLHRRKPCKTILTKRSAAE